MSRIIITVLAAQGLERCRQFLQEKNPHAMKRAAEMIDHCFNLLAAEPKIGRPLEDIPVLRELIIPFGNSGYIALYHYESKADLIYLLAFCHQKEAGY